MAPRDLFPNWLTPVLAIIGSVTGVTGLLLSILNFRRDRAKIDFALAFGKGPPDNPIVHLSMHNAGRRSAYVSDVLLVRTRWWRLGMTKSKPFFPFFASIDGRVLGEASAPTVFTVFQNDPAMLRLTKLGGYVRAYAKVNGTFIKSGAMKIPASLKE